MSFLLTTITSYNQSLDKRIGPHISNWWEVLHKEQCQESKFGKNIDETLLLKVVALEVGFWGWNLWRQPIGFIVFFIASPICEGDPYLLFRLIKWCKNI
jgi:hypothetical protein